MKAFQKAMEKQGISIAVQHKANRAEKKADGVHVEIENVQTGEKKVEVFDRVLVAVGRRPRTDGLNAEKAGVTVTERGFIPPTSSSARTRRTSIPSVTWPETPCWRTRP